MNPDDVTRPPDRRVAADGGDMPTAMSGGPAQQGTTAPADSPLTSARWDGDTTGLPHTADRAARQSDGGPLVVGHKFGPRYQIIRLLGLGGMGAVYQAWDAELDIVVAIKVILPESTHDPNETRALERRFKQELVLARQVTHRNVVRIHDLGEIDGIKYITMSYIQGADLATVLKDAGKLPVPAALKIMRHVAAGLLAAHEAGVVHRDLKPANIMIEGDNAIIMDFGIARSAGGTQPVPPADEALSKIVGHTASTAQRTMAGTIVGTLRYMAPEQARGETADQRADIYALGLIVSDMLLGLRARRSELSAFEELQHRMSEPAPSIGSIDPAIPEALDGIISRCVERDAAARFQTTAELVAALDRLDDEGCLRPVVRRLTPRLMAVAVVLVVALLTATYVVTRRAVEPTAPHEPVSVLIADLDNKTGDPSLNGVLEPMLRRALEGAGFITAIDRSGLSRTLGVKPPERFNEVAARELAVKQGLGFVVSGAIGRQGSRYALSVKAVETVTGNVVTTASGQAASQAQVIEAATRLMTRVRSALGDEQSQSAQMFNMASLSTTSLDVVRLYAAAQDAGSNAKFEEARQLLTKAVQLDPKFGVGYQLLAVQSQNLRQSQDAVKYIQEATRHLDDMTERERYSTRGFYYRVTGDYQQCVKEYGELVARYAADVTGHNQVALCASQLRDMNRAVTEMRQLVKMLPNRILFRDNLALYANYAGDFQTGEQESQTVLAQEPDPFAMLALGFAQLGQGRLPQARETYEKLGAISARGASLAASGLGDLATLEGRYLDAVRILSESAARDLMSKNPDRAAAKFAALSYAELSRGRTRAAVQAAENALANSKMVKIRFLAARLFVEAGDADRARPLIAGLENELEAEPRAYANIVEGNLAMKSGNPREAIKLFIEAGGLLDTWIGHFDLGRAYLDAGAFTQADSEFDRCIKRRGESLALFLDEEPTFAYSPVLYYYQGRVREGLKNAGFAESYRAYLNIRGQSKEDVLLPEVRRRAGL